MPVRKNSSSTSFSLVAATSLSIGRPIMRATWPAQMLPKLPEGTVKLTFWGSPSPAGGGVGGRGRAGGGGARGRMPRLGRLEITREVVHHLGQQPRPVDRVDRADAV